MTILQFIAEAIPAQYAPVPLGIRAENEVTQVELDFSAWAEEFGAGVVQLLVKRQGDASAYPVLLTQSGNTAVWTVSSTDLAVRGDLEAEYIYTVGTLVKKSVVLRFFVQRDIGAAGSAPDPYEEWLAELTALAAQAEAASLAIQDMSVKAETLAPGSAATVTKSVDPETGAVTLSFGIPRGQDGGGGGGSVSPYTSNPAALGTASPGSSDNYARGDHVHPKPTPADIGAGTYSKPSGGIPASDLASGVIPSVPSPSDATPQALGTAAAGSSANYSRADHVHAIPSASDVGAVAANQGVGNAGKWLKVDTDGTVIAATLPLYNGGFT